MFIPCSSVLLTNVSLLPLGSPQATFKQYLTSCNVINTSVNKLTTYGIPELFLKDIMFTHINT